MKSFETFKHQLTEAVSPEHQRFDALVRAGLMDKTKLSKLHRSMDKLNQDQPLSPQERQMIFDLVQELTHLVTSNLGVFQKVRQAVKEEIVTEGADSSAVAMYTQEPPPLVVLRRKAIRMYPHQTKVALYYSDKLDRYFTVPYQETEKSE